MEWLQKVSGNEAAGLLQSKQRQIEELLARQRSGRPAHVQLKDLEEKLEKKQKALNKQNELIPALEEKTRKAREAARASYDAD